MGPIESEKPSGAAVCPVMGGAGSIVEATLTDPAILARPKPFYAAIRSEDPVHYDPKLNMYLVSRFEDLQVVLRDPLTFSVEHGYKEQYSKGFFEEFKQILVRDGGGFFPDAIMTDPPAHTRVRKLMDKAFTAHRVKQLEPGIRDITVGILEGLAEKGKVDAVNDFAVPMTIRVICEQLGISQFNGKKIQGWSAAVTAQIGRMQNREQMVENAKEICELQNFLIGEIRDRQKTPREDMISDLVHARAADEEHAALTFEEVVSLVRALMIAGNETTATGLANLMLILATEPEILKTLQAAQDDDRLMTRFVEELLRIAPPVRGLSRMTTKEVQLGGKTLPKGAHMLLLFASGNDDDKEFACPREFDLNRSNLGRHVAFGAGVHKCIGISLARMEIKVAAQEIVRRFDDIKLAVPLEEIKYLPTVATHSIASLPITFERRS